ncbi:hypothetical protein ACF07S_10520 [Streptomyces sp. NPDC016640]|uniref:hypothetical protein n=1 Tax=Streptomyces sp. NPDC016640 TaxID=3364969 RepID=UPI0036F9AF55
MTKPAPRVHRDLAWAIKQQAKRAGEQTPSVRGADWRLATVTAVGVDGTVTADDILCRRMETYTLPLVGDVIVITQSSSGNWLALGRTDPGTGTPWRAYTPAWTAATTNPSLGNGTITGRYTRLPGRTCVAAIRLVTGSTTTYGSGAYLFSVPLAAADDVVEYVGTARLTAGSTYIGQAFLGAGSSVMNVTFPAAATPATAANMSPTAPATLASGHILRLEITYQTA